MGNFFSGRKEAPCPMLEPWRKPHQDLTWESQGEFKKALIKEIKQVPSVDSLKPCLLLVGPVSAGKSSVANTFLSAGADDILHKAEVGEDVSSLTTKYTRYDSRKELSQKYRVCDTTGILSDVNTGIRPTDILKVIRGKVAAGYKFQEADDISEDDPKYVKDPADQDKSHCLVIVLDSTTVPELPIKYKEKVRNALRAARDEGVATAIVLTKIDRLCEHVMKDKSTLFTCKHAKDIVSKTSETVGLPESKIFPVINYSTEVSKHEATPIDTIALLALLKLLKLSYGYLEGPEDNEAMENQSTKSTQVAIVDGSAVIQ